MFLEYGTEKIFSRRDVSDLPEITISPTAELLRKLKENNIIESIQGMGKGKYHFKKYK